MNTENKEKNHMDFNELLKLFENNKGTDIELSNNYNDDKYSVEIYNTGLKGNLVINKKACVNLLFHIDKHFKYTFVEITPCIDDMPVSKCSVELALDDNIMKIKDFIDINFLTSLTNYKPNKFKNLLDSLYKKLIK